MHLILGSYKYMIYVFLGLLTLMLFVGCAENKRREVQVTEEQQIGEVQEDQPGEMIVE